MLVYSNCYDSTLFFLLLLQTQVPLKILHIDTRSLLPHSYSGAELLPPFFLAPLCLTPGADSLGKTCSYGGKECPVFSGTWVRILDGLYDSWWTWEYQPDTGLAFWWGLGFVSEDLRGWKGGQNPQYIKICVTCKALFMVANLWPEVQILGADGFVWQKKCVLFSWIGVTAMGDTLPFLTDFTILVILTQLICVTCLTAEDGCVCVPCKMEGPHLVTQLCLVAGTAPVPRSSQPAHKLQHNQVWMDGCLPSTWSPL